MAISFGNKINQDDVLNQDGSALKKAMNSFSDSPVFASEPIGQKPISDMESSITPPSPTDGYEHGAEEAPMPETASAIPQAGQSPSPHFFSAGGIGKRIAGVIGDALLLANGRYPLYLPAVMEHNRRIDQQNAQQQQRDFSNNLATSKLNQQQANIEAKASQPQYHFGADGRILSLNPMTGEATQIRDPDMPLPSEHERMISHIVNLPANDPERKAIERLLFKNK
ncbi:hypothetical protein [Zymomonas sp.]|uniref:hypothetical protein n=1 Tax=Zymomonas sp. TaxID=2068624 RepID=UPI0025E36BB4|nr:hypothetical protein [Zymomonas sp.]MCA1955261.1 hypothetical protein [Zymomonas sp.]